MKRNSLRASGQWNVGRTALVSSLVALLFATQPLAQAQRDGTVAKLVDVTGNVLVSRDAGLASGAEALRLLPRTRIITTANATAVIEYDDGCRVELKPNQRFEVEDDRNCAALALLPQTLLAAPAASLATTLVPAIFGAAAIGMILDSRGGQTVSPS